MATFTKEQQAELDDLMMKGDVISKVLDITPRGYMPGILFDVPGDKRIAILGTENGLSLPKWFIDKLYKALK